MTKQPHRPAPPAYQARLTDAKTTMSSYLRVEMILTDTLLLVSRYQPHLQRTNVIDHFHCVYQEISDPSLNHLFIHEIK